MAEDAWQLEPIGARVIDADPVRSIWLPLERGVHALYGLNGAGKTRLLQSVADLYAGRGAGYVVARAVEVESAESRGLIFRPEPDSPWMEMDDPEREQAPNGRWWRAEGRSGLERRTGNHLWSALLNMTSADIDMLGRSVDEIVGQRLFALTPGGDADGRPTWRVTPAVLITGETPVLQQDQQRLLEIGQFLERALLELDQASSDPLDRDEDGWDRLLAEVRAAGLGPWEGDSLLTCLTPMWDALRDGWADWLLHETALLVDAGVVPYRIGDSDGFAELDTLTGGLSVVVRNDQLGMTDVDRWTRRLLRSGLKPEELVQRSGESVEAGTAMQVRSAGLESAADALYRTLLVDAPELKLRLRPPSEWFDGEPTVWQAVDLTDATLDLDQLSEAQRRWALVAILLTLAREREGGADEIEQWHLAASTGNLPVIVALDEPDAALHATAQRHAVTGLVMLSESLDGPILVSTHSREFLNAPEVALHHVTRDIGGSTVVHRVGAPALRQLDEFGLHPADLFLLHRVIVIVEGVHDQVVLDALLGDYLERARALVVPMRGGRNLATVVDAYMLSMYSDVPVVVVMDNLRAQVIEAFWTELCAAQDEGPAALDRVEREHFGTGKKSGEMKYLSEFCRNVLSAGRTDRFHPFGLKKLDIPEYLPVEAFAPGASSWEDLHERHQKAAAGLPFKSWMERIYGTDYSEQSLRAAAATLDHLDADLTRLGDLCEHLAGSRRSR